MSVEGFNRVLEEMRGGRSPISDFAQRIDQELEGCQVVETPTEEVEEATEGEGAEDTTAPQGETPADTTQPTPPTE